MLPRTLEPEVMDTADEAATYDAMDHHQVNVQFVADLLGIIAAATQSLPSTVDPRGDPLIDVLDLGTGTARIPLEICRQTDNLRILAVDDSVKMLDIARINVEIAGFTDRVMLDRADAKQLDFPADRFGVVLSNSLIHHLPEPSSCLVHAVRTTAPGGLLFFRDLMRPETEEEVDHLVSRYASDESDLARQLFQASLHAALTLAEIQDMVSQLGFSPETVAATSDRHWTWTAWRETAKRLAV